MSRKCPKDSRLVRFYVEGAGNPRMAAILDHVVRCPRCRLRFDTLIQLKGDIDPKIGEFARGLDPEVAVRQVRESAREKLGKLGVQNAPGRRRFRLASVTAALAIVVIAAGLFLSRSFFRPVARIRSPSLVLVLMEPVGTVREAPHVFKWTPVLHAESYSIQMIDESLREVFKSGTFLITELVVPPEVRASLERGATYVWSVLATDADSNTVASKSGSFTLR